MKPTETGEAGAGEAGASAAADSRLTRVAMLLPVIGAPAGLAFAILASLMISGWRVQHAAIVQVDTLWQPGDRAALRVHVQAGDGSGIAGAKVRASLTRGAQSIALAELTEVTDKGSLQATVTAPDWPAGDAALVLEIDAPGAEFREVVPIRLDAGGAGRRGTVTVSSSIKNWADDTEPQPEALRIALRPVGRLAAGFENTLLVRVTDPEGRPHVGPVEVRVLDGEFVLRGGSERAALIGMTDAQGLLRFDGQLNTDVVRFEVRVGKPEVAEADAKVVKAEGAKKVVKAEGAVEAKDAGAVEAVEAEVLGARKFRLVSFAGAVRVTAEPLALRVGAGLEGSLEITARALRARKAVFIDVHGPGGRWIDTLTPVTGPEPPRAWSTAGLGPGFLQIEAYQFTTSPGESAALARVQLTSEEPDTDAALAPLFAEQRALLEVGRVEKGFDRALEAKYLDAIEGAEIARAEVPLARAWLLGTLPVEVLGPPLALTTLPREQADLVARRQRWASGLRWFLLGGGGLFLLTTLLLIVVSHRRAAARLTGEIHGEGATAAIAREIAQAQRAVLLRALALVVTMALGLVLTVVVLDKLLWNNG